MKRWIVCWLCLGMIGCCTSAKKKNVALEQELTSAKAAIIQKDHALDTSSKTIKEQQELLTQKDTLLKEKDAKLEELRNKLQSFGVFQ